MIFFFNLTVPLACSFFKFLKILVFSIEFQWDQHCQGTYAKRCQFGDQKMKNRNRYFYFVSTRNVRKSQILDQNFRVDLILKLIAAKRKTKEKIVPSAFKSES
jgi:hypothetical protein